MTLTLTVDALGSPTVQRGLQQRCAFTDLLATECADCRTAKHRASYSARPRADRVELRSETVRIAPGGSTFDGSIVAVHAEIQYLLDHLDQLAATDFAAEAMAEIKTVWQQLRRAHGVSRPKSLGRCITVKEGAECSGKVMPSPTGGRPRCTACSRFYSEKDLVTLQLTEERAKPVKVERTMRPAPTFPPRQDGEPNVDPTIHSGRAGIDQAVAVVGRSDTLYGVRLVDDKCAVKGHVYGQSVVCRRCGRSAKSAATP